jgi:hypothetical protein
MVAPREEDGVDVIQRTISSQENNQKFDKQGKKELCELCIKHGINKINVEWNDHHVEVYSNYNIDKDMVNLHDKIIGLVFDYGQANNQLSFFPSEHELRLGIVG